MTPAWELSLGSSLYFVYLIVLLFLDLSLYDLGARLYRHPGLLVLYMVRLLEFYSNSSCISYPPSLGDPSLLACQVTRRTPAYVEPGPSPLCLIRPRLPARLTGLLCRWAYRVMIPPTVAPRITCTSDLACITLHSWA